MIFHLSLINKRNGVQLTLFIYEMENLYVTSLKKHLLICCLLLLNFSQEIQGVKF